MKSYVGITGYMDRESILRSLTIMDEDTSDRLLMVGILASLKTLDKRGTPSYPNRYPAIEMIPELCVAHERALPLIHYSTDNRFELGTQLERLVNLAGDNLKGFQLNIAWPDIEHLKYLDIVVQRPLEIILQCSGYAMNMCERDPDKIAEKVASYGNLITGALIDPSGGKGKSFDHTFVSQCIEAIQEACPYLTYIVAAGGLHSGCVEKVISPLLDIEPNLSWDAEGCLRDGCDHYIPEWGDGYLSCSLALPYIPSQITE